MCYVCVQAVSKHKNTVVENFITIVPGVTVKILLESFIEGYLANTV